MIIAKQSEVNDIMDISGRVPHGYVMQLMVPLMAGPPRPFVLQ